MRVQQKHPGKLPRMRTVSNRNNNVAELLIVSHHHHHSLRTCLISFSLLFTNQSRAQPYSIRFLRFHHHAKSLFSLMMLTLFVSSFLAQNWNWLPAIQLFSDNNNNNNNKNVGGKKRKRNAFSFVVPASLFVSRMLHRIGLRAPGQVSFRQQRVMLREGRNILRHIYER